MGGVASCGARDMFGGGIAVAVRHPGDYPCFSVRRCRNIPQMSDPAAKNMAMRSHPGGGVTRTLRLRRDTHNHNHTVSSRSTWRRGCPCPERQVSPYHMASRLPLPRAAEVSTGTATIRFLALQRAEQEPRECPTSTRD